MPQILYCEQQAVRLVCMPCRVQCKLQSGDCATKELFNFQRQRLKVLDSVPATPSNSSQSTWSTCVSPWNSYIQPCFDAMQITPRHSVSFAILSDGSV